MCLFVSKMRAQPRFLHNLMHINIFRKMKYTHTHTETRCSLWLCLLEKERQNRTENKKTIDSIGKYQGNRQHQDRETHTESAHRFRVFSSSRIKCDCGRSASKQLEIDSLAYTCYMDVYLVENIHNNLYLYK